MFDIDRLTVLLEPTGACNLRCRHCYHAKTDFDGKEMSADTLERFLAVTSPYYKYVKIIWHGGEPLLMGCEFFEHAYERIDYYSAKYGVKFEFGLQTNGMLLDERMIDIFVKNDTHISISYDGPFNDVLRSDTKRVEEVIKTLKNKGVKFSCLSTISAVSVEHFVELYEYFKELGVDVKFNPIFLDGSARENVEHIITAEQWTKAFTELFKIWLYDRECNIRVSSCTDMLAKYLGHFHSGCVNGTCMFKFLGVDAYGNIYPCGRLIDDGFKLADVHCIADIRQSFLSDKYAELLNANKKRVNGCKDCKWFQLCHAGCNAAAALGGDMSRVSEFECYFTQNIFEFIKELLKDVDPSAINKYAAKILNKK